MTVKHEKIRKLLKFSRKKLVSSFILFFLEEKLNQILKKIKTLKYRFIEMVLKRFDVWAVLKRP